MNHNLVRELKSGTCALILGPEFHLANSANEDVASLTDFLWQTDQLKLMPFLTDDGFFFYKKDDFKQKKDIVFTIQKYYESIKSPVNDLYISLARLPFYTIISLSPDEHIREAFKEINKPHDYRFFAKGEFYEDKNKLEIERETSTERPLICNLLGSYTNWESMVFTHDALFDFLFYLFDLTKLSQKLKTAILNASSFLFLGFKYNRWYLRLIFFLLQKIRDPRGIENVAIYTNNDSFEKIKAFYTDGMKFDFDESRVDAFINELYELCQHEKITFETPEPTVLAPQPSERFKILYVCAAPSTMTDIRGNAEFKRLEQLRKLSDNPNAFELNGFFASSKQEFIVQVEKERPHFVVISAHGTKQNELIFENYDGEAEPASMEQLLNSLRVLVKNPRNKLKYILFSCCNSHQIASSCVEMIGSAIGMQGVIGVDASSKFNEGFFEIFFNTQNFSRAYDFGKLKIDSKGKINYLDVPLLFQHQAAATP